MKKEKKEIMKKIGSIVVAGTILLGSNSIVLAKENNYVSANNIRQNKTNTQEEIEVYYNGEKIEFDQKPILVNDRTLVPFRKVFESMGCIVYYNNSESKVMALTKEGDILTHTIGTNTFDLNGETKTFDSASTILNDRTLIPLRAVAETLSAEVEWNDKEKEIQIKKKIETKDYNKLITSLLECALNQNFNPENFKRYIDYQYKNPSMSNEEVIFNVNMDLDKELVKVYTKEEEIRKFTVNIQYVNELLGKYHYEAKEEDLNIVNDTESPTVLVNRFNRLPENYVVPNFVNANNKEWEEKYITQGLFMDKVNLRDYVVNDYRDLTIAYTNHLYDIGYYNDEKHFYIITPLRSLSWLGYDDNDIERTVIRSSMHNLGIFDKEIEEEYYAYNYSSPRYTNDLSTGLSIDYRGLSNIYYYLTNNLFYDKEIFEWFKDNAYKYGFVIRYPEGKEHITRNPYQPWYLRYVGKDVAKIMYNEDLCLEEYCAKYENKSGYKPDLESSKVKELKLN